MNILILNWKDLKHPQVGGAEIIVYELAKRLVSVGHEVTWFCRSFKYGKHEETIDGVKIVRRGNLVTMYFHAPIYYWKLRKKPDVVVDISNTIYWQTPLWAWQSKRIAYLNQLAQEVFYYEYPVFVSRFGKLAERLQYLAYLNTKFVCYAQSTKADLISMGINDSMISTFSLGVDHDRYFPGKKSKNPLFICVNRLVKMKRTDLVIRAMEIVHKRFPDTRLVVVGYGYDRIRLEKLRDSLNLEDSVKFADENILFFTKNSKDKKVTLMQQAWALVFPSVKEGWGMTVTECAACETPAIVSGVSGLKDSVVDNQTGIILSPNPSPEEIAGAMVSLIKNPKLRNHLSKQARLYSRKFSWDKSYREFANIISRL
ncbi:MAG: Glycosyl transferase, group 1 [Candidatus Amesbacteria bacterium GW2011_GWB1_47_26]|uniref:Glycosyl transferase, group 1 n=1 Tax=Candidatus Amesbacteria bacterium GW2011_GWC2_45_19 TaxID=1618366 RepID=A0A0G1M5T9_9BACT|nr:MAG: Glycosyl transferase, group 1 [Candidatus Amesbacteria bacterium GW2011_GWC2_45_19]KKU38297.1 MAG: Glycosyl transferase, group 1 [Candidatus Amesbacteria bacterium GW2011_GWA1_46_35]KKU69515.1 MAG: Glycosyl transferase, group 1 [Microgenomates group bacterium GW2011_GWC1_47_20]KKU74873.1 MAG: Glycosyl transferase, group 1 [Candidatus Amesbacteria bacterium GW2011_GWB1_47_26]KKU80338.1 MAG: Glycosyl transferase, group 1 [Candidatus Amesbacteria bacterium GW2011_GWA2_47_70]